MGDFVHIDAAVVGFLLIVTVSALKTYMNTQLVLSDTKH